MVLLGNLARLWGSPYEVWDISAGSPAIRGVSPGLLGGRPCKTITKLSTSFVLQSSINSLGDVIQT